ncbi:GNAT family N-acetyltransferase [Bailinhaonella thermotolerans]|uniref:GNAT family N-acetyltransferase n=1 Tax=Bailinhaonella thermotolerans TaxID=1070861 RepID=A0A3A4BNL7_9ACTN|nr:GNAT family N-acetyltransferase [Bailinhaonella thermotolerans]RJL32644.1 GNAT family N-acetyltransferase [Bailinhaonella thermotolerans]
MKITSVHPRDLGESELQRWRDLQRSGRLLPNPFLSPEFTLIVGELRADVRVAVVEDGPRIAGFLPYQRHALGVGRPVGAGLTDQQGMVHAPGLELDPRALLRACRLDVWEFDHLAEDQTVLGRHATSLHASPIMDLSGGFEAYREHIRRGSTYRGVTAKRRRLSREAGPVHHDFESADTGALRTLLGWKSAQYRRTGRTDRFARPWIVELVERLHATKTETFSGSLSVLYAGDVPVAGHFGLRTETVMAHWFPAYDPGFGRHSPGLVQHLEMAGDAAAAGLLQIDMGRGDKRYKDSLKNGELTVAEGRVARATPRALVHWIVRTPVRRARIVTLANPRLREHADRVLRGYGRFRTSVRDRAALVLAGLPAAEAPTWLGGII